MNPPVKRRKRGRRAATKKTLEIAHFWAGAEQEPVNSLIRVFEKKNPHVRVRQKIMNWWTYTTTMKREIGESPPDVMVHDIGENLLRFLEDDELLDITEMWERKKFYDVFPEWIKKKCSYQGRMYLVPSKYFTYAVWYLTDVFKKHGVKPPKTWDEFINVCRAFKESGIHPIISSGDGIFDLFMSLLAQVGGASFYEELVRGVESWKDPRVVETYEILRELSKEYMYPHPFGFNSPMAWVKLNNREAAMHLQGDWLNGMWQREYGYTPGKEYNYFLLPPIHPSIGRVMVVGGNAWAIPKNARHPDLARRFLEYAGSLEAHTLMARKGMGILAHKNVPEQVYDRISAGLRNELSKHPTVHALGSALPLKITSMIIMQNMKIVMNPDLKRKDIESLTAEIDMVAREHRVLRSLSSLRGYLSG